MIRQIVVAAGGFGERISSKVSSRGGKVMINFKGKPLIYYVLKSAKEAGIEDFLISVNKQNRSKIKKIAKDLDINFSLKLTAPGYTGVPLIFFNKLDDKFIFTCGHHIISREYFSALIKKSKEHKIVSSFFTEPNFRQKDIFLKKNGKDFKLKDVSSLKRKPDGYYLGSPYVVTKEMAKEIKKFNFKLRWQQLIYLHWSQKDNVYILQAPMPQEFDYFYEYKNTLKYLNNLY